MHRRAPAARWHALAWAGLLLALVPCAQAEIEIKVSVERDAIYVGESVEAYIDVVGTSSSDEPDLSAITGARVEVLGGTDTSSSGVVMVNGRIVRGPQTSYRWAARISPMAAGSVTLAPVRVKVDGRLLSADGPTITVRDISNQTNVLVFVETSSDEVRPGETFDILTRVLIKQLPERWAGEEPLIPGSPPVLQAEHLGRRDIPGLDGPVPAIPKLLESRLAQRRQKGIRINDYTVQSNPFGWVRSPLDEKIPAKIRLDRSIETHDGTTYVAYDLRVQYTARRHGSYTFGPASFRGDIPINADAGGNATLSEVYALSETIAVRVSPPDETDRPPKYSGIVSSNLSLEAELDTQTCYVGDPITLTLRYRGDGIYDNARTPRFEENTQLTDRFLVASDRINIAPAGDDGLSYTVVLRPTRPGTFELPELSFSYLDVWSDTFCEVSTQPIPIRVNAADLVGSDALIGNADTNSAGAAARIEVGIAPVRFVSTGATADPLRLTKPLLVAFSGPLLFLVIVAARSARAWLRRRRPSAGITLREALARIDALCAGSTRSGQGLAQDAVRDVQAAFSTIEGLGASASPEQIRVAALELGIVEDVARAAEAWLDALTAYAYDPSATDEAVADHMRAAETRLAPLHPLFHRRRRARRAATLATLALLLPTFALAAQSDPFAWEHANTLLATAHAEQAFRSAADAYQRMLDAGVKNGHVLYNQGTALLCAGQYAMALQRFERAERYLGHDTDLHRNMLAAQRGLDGDEQAALPWYRVPLFWHYGIGMSTRAGLASVAFALAWMLACTRFAGRTDWRAPCACCAFFFVVLSSSVATSLHQESTDDQRVPEWSSAPASAGETPE